MGKYRITWEVDLELPEFIYVPDAWANDDEFIENIAEEVGWGMEAVTRVDVPPPPKEQHVCFYRRSFLEDPEASMMIELVIEVVKDGVPSVIRSSSHKPKYGGSVTTPELAVLRELIETGHKGYFFDYVMQPLPEPVELEEGLRILSEKRAADRKVAKADQYLKRRKLAYTITDGVVHIDWSQRTENDPLFDIVFKTEHITDFLESVDSRSNTRVACVLSPFAYMLKAGNAAVIWNPAGKYPIVVHWSSVMKLAEELKTYYQSYKESAT